MEVFLKLMAYFWPTAAALGVLRFFYIRYFKKSTDANQSIQSYILFFVYFLLGTYIVFPIVSVLAESIRSYEIYFDPDILLVKVLVIFFLNEFIMYVIVPCLLMVSCLIKTLGDKFGR